jgi:hypothetical protein
MIGLSDTSPDAERVLYEAYRRMTPARKWKNLADDYRMARDLHAAGMRFRNPAVTVAEIQAAWMHDTLGAPCPVPIPGGLMDPVAQDYQVVLRFVIRTLDRLGVKYAIGGSIASSMHGPGRFTRDADITVEPFLGRERLFVAAFDPNDFYLSADSVRDALRDRSTFNVIHPATGYKIDFFVRKDEPFERSAFARRVALPMSDAPDELVQLHSAEDIILFKLRWYEIGGRVSDRQLNDILGVMKTQGDALDAGYLDTWAGELGVSDLLADLRKRA